MRKICVINQKGGVGKTTTAANVAIGLARKGNRVLIIDCDPQGNISNCLETQRGATLFDFISGAQSIEGCTHEVEENLFVVPANETLTKAEFLLAGETARETYLLRNLKVSGYDYVLLDCPPSLGLLNQNALLYADEALIPTSTEPLGLDALHKMLGAIKTLNGLFGHELAIAAIVPTMYDGRLKVCRRSLAKLQEAFYDKIAPVIRVNSKLREAPGERSAIYDYAKYSRGAKDYRCLVEFLVAQRAQRTPQEELVTQTI